jgi:hypothetical protein
LMPPVKGMYIVRSNPLGSLYSDIDLHTWWGGSQFKHSLYMMMRDDWVSTYLLSLKSISLL